MAGLSREYGESVGGPLENTSYLSKMKPHWDTYGQAKDELERVKNALSLEKMTSYADSMQPIAEAFGKLQKKLWKDADNSDSFQELT